MSYIDANGSQVGGTFGVISRTTVPGPTSLALLGLGLAGFGFPRKKKKA